MDAVTAVHWLLRLLALGCACLAGWIVGPGWPYDGKHSFWLAAACAAAAVAAAWYGWPPEIPIEPLNTGQRTWAHWMFYQRGWWWLLLAAICGAQLAHRQRTASHA